MKAISSVLRCATVCAALIGFGSAAHADDERYWNSKYAALPAPVWPVADASTCAPSSAEACIELPAESTRLLLGLARDTGASPAQVLLGVVGAYVRQSTGASDFVVGVPVHNRVYRRQKSLFGMFTTIMPSRVTFDGTDTFRQLVRAIGTDQNADMVHRRYPFTQLARQLRARSGRRDSLFDVADRVQVLVKLAPIRGADVVSGSSRSILRFSAMAQAAGCRTQQ